MIAILSERRVQILDLPDLPRKLQTQADAVSYLTTWTNELRIPDYDSGKLLQNSWSFDVSRMRSSRPRDTGSLNALVKSCGLRSHREIARLPRNRMTCGRSCSPGHLALEANNLVAGLAAAQAVPSVARSCPQACCGETGGAARLNDAASAVLAVS